MSSFRLSRQMMSRSARVEQVTGFLFAFEFVVE
jgi:hypothetical protein